MSQLREAEHEVIAAAECVTHSYRAYAGYTVPLSINLRRLDAAVRAWQVLIHRQGLDGGHSNEQTPRKGCAAARQS